MSLRKTPRKARPPLWAEGRQHPPFDARAFLRASVALTRESLSGVLERCAVSTAGFAATVASGRLQIPQARLGRTGRFLPGHRRVAGGIAVVSEAMELGSGLAAGDDLLPEPTIFALGPLPQPEAAAPVFTPTLVPQTPSARETPAADADLLAIRSLLDTDPVPEPARPLRTARAAPLPLLAAPEPGNRPLRRLTVAVLARVFGYGLLPVLLPWGAGRATLAHLNGQDLRQQDA